MRKTAYWMLMVVLGGQAAVAQRNLAEDRSVDPALLTWSDPSAWRAGFEYIRKSRLVELDGQEWDLRGDVYEASVGVSPWPWLLLFGTAGGSQARLDNAMAEDAGYGPGGSLGARLNLWQLDEGVQSTAWQLTLQLSGEYAYWTTRDRGEGDLQWSETLVMLPLDYHLTFARTFRNVFMTEFQGFNIYLGPAFSRLDGAWSRTGLEREFEQVQSYGAVGGADLWLLENLAFGVRFDWFEVTTVNLAVRYRF